MAARTAFPFAAFLKADGPVGIARVAVSGAVRLAMRAVSRAGALERRSLEKISAARFSRCLRLRPKERHHVEFELRQDR